MNIAVRYFSRSGNTRKVADAIAKAAGVEAKDCSAALTQPVDILFLGGSIYAGGVDKSLIEFINTLNPSMVKKVAAFGTSALKKEPDKETENRVREKGIAVSGRSFHCWGSFTLLHRGRPNDEDLKQAADFAHRVINEK